MEIWTLTYIHATSGSKVWIDDDSTEVFTDKAKALKRFEKYRKARKYEDWLPKVQTISESEMQWEDIEGYGNYSIRCILRKHKIKTPAKQTQNKA